MIVFRRIWPILLLGAIAVGAFVAGCSNEESPTAVTEAGGSQTEIRGEVDGTSGTFTLLESEPAAGPRLALIGRNVTFDPDAGVCSVELAVRNLGSEAVGLPVHLVFESFVPPEVEVVDPDDYTDAGSPLVMFGSDGTGLGSEEMTDYRPTSFLCSTGSFAFTGHLIPSPPPPPEGVIAGAVFNDLDRDGEWSPEEPPIPDVWVLLYSLAGEDTLPDTTITDSTLAAFESQNVVPLAIADSLPPVGPIAETKTDLHGRFAFADLEPGLYRVEVHNTRVWLPTTPPAWMLLLVATDDGVSSIRGLLSGWTTRDGMIGGRVFHDEDGDGEIDDGEEGLAGRLVLARPAFFPIDPPLRTLTDGTGRYLFQGLDGGTWSVYLVPVPGESLTTANPLDVFLPVTREKGWVGRFFDAHFGVQRDSTADVVRGCMEFIPSTIDLTHEIRYSFYLARVCLPPGTEGVVSESIRLNHELKPDSLRIAECADSLSFSPAGWLCCCDSADSTYLELKFDPGRVIDLLMRSMLPVVERPIWITGTYEDGTPFVARTWVRFLSDSTRT
jgi:hypothetical protein